MSSHTELAAATEHPFQTAFNSAIDRYLGDTRGNPLSGRELTLAFSTFVRADLHKTPLWPDDGEPLEDEMLVTWSNLSLRGIGEERRDYAPLQGKDGIRYAFDGSVLRAQDLTLTEAGYRKGEPREVSQEEEEQLIRALDTSPSFSIEDLDLLRQKGLVATPRSVE